MVSAPASVPGVVVVDKPRGPTSHDVVARIRKIVKSRQVGHAGTLDPMATGVLVVAIGEGTKLVPWLTAADKEYIATIKLGVETDTLDAEGRETERVAIGDEVRRALAGEYALLEPALASERARREQVPPAFSAIRVGGERAHDLARAGKLEDALPARPVAVRALEVIGASPAASELTVRIAAAKGYFVRSLARDLARGLGTRGHLTALRRTRAGRFTIEEAVTLDALTPSSVVDLDAAAKRALPVSVLDAEGVRAVGFGQRVAPPHLAPPHAEPSAWVDVEGRLLAVGECDVTGLGRVLRGFPRA